MASQTGQTSTTGAITGGGPRPTLTAEGLVNQVPDIDPEETQDWLESLDDLLDEKGKHRARFVMTRSDFIRQHHDLSIFSIDSHAVVRADSVPMQRAFNEICAELGFEDFLEATLERIGAIESLGRTKELTFKDLWEGGKYRITTRDRKGNVQGEVEMETVPGKTDDDDDDDGDDKKDD